MFISSGGSVVGSSNITDGAIVNADINNAAAIPIGKLDIKEDATIPFVAIESTAGATHSLTTIANQECMIVVTGSTNGAIGARDINLKYNGTILAKTDIKIDGGTLAERWPFAITANVTPGAATANITVDGGSALANINIVVLKLMIA